MEAIKPIEYPVYLRSINGMFWRIASPDKYSVVRAAIRTYSKYFSFMKTDCSPGATEHLINDMDLLPSTEMEYFTALQEYTEYAAEIASNLPQPKIDNEAT